MNNTSGTYGKASSTPKKSSSTPKTERDREKFESSEGKMTLHIQENHSKFNSRILKRNNGVQRAMDSIFTQVNIQLSVCTSAPACTFASQVI